MDGTYSDGPWPPAISTSALTVEEQPITEPSADAAPMPKSFAQQLTACTVSCVICNAALQGMSYMCGGARLHQMAALAVGVQYLVLLHASGNVFGNERTEKFFDLTGSLTYLSLTVFAVLAAGWDVLTQRQLMVAAMVAIWAARLGTFLFGRIKIHGGIDPRFSEIKKYFPAFFNFWNIQGMWGFLTALPAFVVLAQDRGPKELGLVDYAGALLWAFGFAFEVVADTQKGAWRARPENAGKKTWITGGLWSVCRHPNYFGEITLWSAVLLIASQSLLQGPAAAWACAVSPFFVMLLLLYVSGIPMLAESGLKKWGEEPAYQEFLAKTPIILPFCPWAPKEAVALVPILVLVSAAVRAM